MNNAFKQSQQSLNSIQRKVKQLLQEIQFLDKQCLEVQYDLEMLQQDYLDDMKAKIVNGEQLDINGENTKLEDIAKLQQKLKQLAEKKVKLSQQMETIVVQCTKEIENNICQTAENVFDATNLKQQIRSHHLFQSGLRKQKGRQKNVNPQIKTIIKDYYNQKDSQYTALEQVIKKYCICKSDVQLQQSQSMIECQNSKCKIGWFHFQCVGIKSDYIPDHWYCDKCHIQQMKKINKITYQYEEKQVQIQIQKQKSEIEDSFDGKRKGRGRPRKIQKVL